MEDLIQIIFVAVVIVGAAIWKLLVKLLGSGAAGKTLTEIGRQAKPLIDALSGEQSADPMKRRRQEEEERGETPRPKPEGRALAPAPRSSMEEAQMSPFQRLEERLRQFAEQRMEQMQEPPPVRQPEVKPAPKPRPAKPVEARKPPPKPVRRERPPVGGLVGGLGAARPQALREAILLREILGPPKAMAGGLYGRPGGMHGGMSAIVPPRPPPPPPAAPTRPEPQSAVPERVREMYEMGMLTREQYEALCEHFSSK